MKLNQKEIEELLPHGDPFLFLNSATVDLKAGKAAGSYTITGKEDFLRGHFRHRPVFPGSLMIESLGQLCVLLLIADDGKVAGAPIDGEKIFFTICDGVRCQRVCEPGDVLELSVELTRLRMPLAFFKGHITTGGEPVAKAGKLTLSFAVKG